MNEHIFREYDIRGIVGEDLTDETVSKVADALAYFYISNGVKKIAIGYDARESSPGFAEILSKGLNTAGIDVALIGQVPTPVLYHTVYTKDVDGGVMITGSHNPPEYNGFKICLGKQTLFGSQIREIKEIALAGKTATGNGVTETLSVLSEYINDIVTRTKLGPRKLRVAIDSGNGMGGVTAVPVLKEIGVELKDIFSDPDSSFPNHHPDPTVEENLEHLKRLVDEESADVGIAYDGDGDRIGVVDENGKVLWGDELMVLYSRDVLEKFPGSTIIGEVKCSQTLYEDIEAKGGNAVMFKAGHSIIKNKMKESGAKLAGEMSGHIFFADDFYGFDDACYATCRLLEILSKTEKPLSALTADLPTTFSTPELRTPCAEEKKFEVVSKIAEEFSKDHEVNTIDGARIQFENGWGLVRASNTQAILVLRFEAMTEEDLQKIRTIVETRVKELIG